MATNNKNDDLKNIAGIQIVEDPLSPQERRDFLVKIYEERAEFLIRHEIDQVLYKQDAIIVKDDQTQKVLDQKLAQIDFTITRVKRTLKHIKSELLKDEKPKN